LAKARSEAYVKGDNEDFNTLLNGIIGQKRGIHIHIGDVLTEQIDTISKTVPGIVRQIQELTELIDRQIILGYKLWPTKYIAHDLLYGTNQFADKYTSEEKELFERRFRKGVDQDDPVAVKSFLAMYANPVVNQMKIRE
jgi:hypothetical protein